MNKQEFDKITTWQTGCFVLSAAKKKMTHSEIEFANLDESHRVRPSPTGNHICVCVNPEIAEWLCGRLNKLAEIENK